MEKEEFMLRNTKGAALMQVLLVTAILAGMATMLLRASLSRTTSARQTRQSVSTELLIESCQAEINMMWSQKKPETFQRDLAGCWMNCNIKVSEDNWTSGSPYTSSKCHTQSGKATHSYTCKVPVHSSTVDVVATFAEPSSPTSGAACQLEYTIATADIDKL